MGQIIDPNLRGLQENNNGIFKAQYQKNIGTSAYVRLYGYTNYSNWMIYDPPYNGGAYEPFSSIGQRDYELNTHTRGGALEFADQINSRNLLQGSASYTFSSSPARTTTRCPAPATGSSCVTATATATARTTDRACADQLLQGPEPHRRLYAGQLQRDARSDPRRSTHGRGPLPSGGDRPRRDVQHRSTRSSARSRLSDQMSVGDQLKLDLGLRFNSYIYALADTTQQALTGGSNNLLFQNYNQEHCYNAATQTFALATAASGFTCAAGFTHTNLSNDYPSAVGATVLEPRIGGTYTISPYDVIRFSAGKYSQPIISAYVQYNRAGDLASYTASNFYEYGFNTPRHEGSPQLSFNYDLTYEKRFKNSPLSFSATPFFRRTQDQSQSFFLDPRTNFVSGLNVGTLRAFGSNCSSRYGDFNRDGISGQVSFAYTNSKIKYTNFNGTSTAPTSST